LKIFVSLYIKIKKLYQIALMFNVSTKGTASKTRRIKRSHIMARLKPAAKIATGTEHGQIFVIRYFYDFSIGNAYALASNLNSLTA